jgi:hypothetical protein
MTDWQKEAQLKAAIVRTSRCYSFVGDLGRLSYTTSSRRYVFMSIRQSQRHGHDRPLKVETLSSKVDAFRHQRHKPDTGGNFTHASGPPMVALITLTDKSLRIAGL